MALNLSPYRAVLFDVDGTIAETEGEGHLPAFNQVFKEFSLPWQWSTSDYAALLSITGGAERMTAYARQIGDQDLLTPAGQAKILQMHQRKNLVYAERLQSGLLHPRPGFIDLVQRIIREGRDWAVVTTTSRANWNALWRNAILRHAELPPPRLAICGEDVQRKKPDPQAYVMAIQQLGLPAHQAVAIEDSPNGLAAAQAADIATVIVRSQFFANAPVPGALAVVNQLTEL